MFDFNDKDLDYKTILEESLIEEKEDSGEWDKNVGKLNTDTQLHEDVAAITRGLIAAPVVLASKAGKLIFPDSATKMQSSIRDYYKGNWNSKDGETPFQKKVMNKMMSLIMSDENTKDDFINILKDLIVFEKGPDNEIFINPDEKARENGETGIDWWAKNNPKKLESQGRKILNIIIGETLGKGSSRLNKNMVEDFRKRITEGSDSARSINGGSLFSDPYSIEATNKTLEIIKSIVASLKVAQLSINKSKNDGVVSAEESANLKLITDKLPNLILTFTDTIESNYSKSTDKAKLKEYTKKITDYGTSVIKGIATSIGNITKVKQDKLAGEVGTKYSPNQVYPDFDKLAIEGIYTNFPKEFIKLLNDEKIKKRYSENYDKSMANKENNPWEILKLTDSELQLLVDSLKTPTFGNIIPSDENVNSVTRINMPKDLEITDEDIEMGDEYDTEQKMIGNELLGILGLIQLYEEEQDQTKKEKIKNDLSIKVEKVKSKIDGINHKYSTRISDTLKNFSQKIKTLLVTDDLLTEEGQDQLMKYSVMYNYILLSTLLSITYVDENTNIDSDDLDERFSDFDSLVDTIRESEELANKGGLTFTPTDVDDTDKIKIDKAPIDITTDDLANAGVYNQLNQIVTSYINDTLKSILNDSPNIKNDSDIMGKLKNLSNNIDVSLKRLAQINSPLATYLTGKVDNLKKQLYSISSASPSKVGVLLQPFLNDNERLDIWIDQLQATLEDSKMITDKEYGDDHNPEA